MPAHLGSRGHLHMVVRMLRRVGIVAVCGNSNGWADGARLGWARTRDRSRMLSSRIEIARHRLHVVHVGRERVGGRAESRR